MKLPMLAVGMSAALLAVPRAAVGSYGVTDDIQRRIDAASASGAAR